MLHGNVMYQCSRETSDVMIRLDSREVRNGGLMLDGHLMFNSSGLEIKHGRLVTGDHIDHQGIVPPPNIFEMDRMIVHLKKFLTFVLFWLLSVKKQHQALLTVSTSMSSSHCLCFFFN